MLTIRYQKMIPCPFEVVLGQYFDYEHIKYVHPKTLGEYRLVEQRRNVIYYEQLWPKNLLGRGRSLVRHEFEPPNAMWFVFESGRYKGNKVFTKILASADSTLVDETYYMPLPNWSWLARLIRPWVMRKVDRIWDEDLAVSVAHGGWPGVPHQPKAVRSGQGD